MRTTSAIAPAEVIEGLIQTIRGQRVILDSDLARIYGVPTRQLNQAVRRNPNRFPNDFAFQLTAQEIAALRSQIVISNGRGGRRYFPYAFTEHGAIMAANVLNSSLADQMSVFVVRAFVKMRETLASHRELATKLAELEAKLTERLDIHEKAVTFILNELKKLREPEPEPKRKQIGFHVRDQASTLHEQGTPYRVTTQRKPSRKS